PCTRREDLRDPRTARAISSSVRRTLVQETRRGAAKETKVRIALAVPAYRQGINIHSAVAWMQDALTARELGWQPFPLWVDCSGMARARNVIVKTAEDAGARLLLMMDSDSFPDVQEGALGHMWHVMQQESAAVVAAAFVTRNGTRVNCEPVKPGEVYEGEV